ncbi:MAG: hypothetical protein V4724_23575 [Pseudomonadota bacterium]
MLFLINAPPIRFNNFLWKICKLAYLLKDIWQKEFSGWLITDCAVRSKTVIYICLRKDVPEEQASRMFDHDIHTEMFVLSLAEPQGTRSGVRTLTGYNKPRLGIALLPQPQGLLAARNRDGQVSVMGGGSTFPDEFIHPDNSPMPWRIKCINGYAYSVGGQRKIYKRVDIGKWERFADLPRSEHIERVGFNDMDAFSESDMYAVGGHGDVWHYDGKIWTQMGFPSNVQLGTVTCAGDGNVYISGEGGSLWIGKKSTWKRVYQGGSSILWNDVLWFEGKLWLASDYKLRVWDGKEMQSVKHKGEEVSAYGHMDARDGLLIVASPYAVWGFDGKEWKDIVAPYID